MELGALRKNLSYRILEWIGSRNYSAADIVLGQSEEILTHVKSLFPEKKLVLYRNYPDFENTDKIVMDPSATGQLRIVYAGLLGVAQGIHKLVQNLDYKGIELHIYGSGAEQEKIETFISSHPNLPIFFHGRVTRDELHGLLPKYDLVLIPLLNRIYGSVPSKIFEYAKLGLPILYFGGGEGEDLVSKFKLGWVAKAGDYEYLNFVISSIHKDELNSDFRLAIRETANSKFDFQRQLDRVIENF